MACKLKALAGDVSQIKIDLKRDEADDIFDDSAPFSLPSFQVSAYRRQH
jgi:hypothetical protein